MDVCLLWFLIFPILTKMITTNANWMYNHSLREGGGDGSPLSSIPVSDNPILQFLPEICMSDLHYKCFSILVNISVSEILNFGRWDLWWSTRCSCCCFLHPYPFFMWSCSSISSIVYNLELQSSPGFRGLAARQEGTTSLYCYIQSNITF